jgi:hypothetical protein
MEGCTPTLVSFGCCGFARSWYWGATSCVAKGKCTTNPADVSCLPFGWVGGASSRVHVPVCDLPPCCPCGMQVFGPAATQHEVFETAVLPVVADVCAGLNAAVFAYGATDTGGGSLHRLSRSNWLRTCLVCGFQ